jgi:LuxR family maltose regulon positive regulatory protein
VPLDDDRQWYRYHHLFADLLRARLQQYSAELVNVLHLQASQWFEDQDLLNEAVEHALLSKDYHRSANLIDRSSQTRVLINVFIVQKWIQQIPEEIISGHPWINISQAWIWLSMGKLENIEACLEQAEDCIRSENNQTINVIETQDIRGHIAMLRAYLAFFHGDPATTIEQGSLALRDINPSNNFLRSRIALQLGSLILF